jgi:hypothetical protein
MTMALRVIGAGFGRTGTLSLKAGLEQLGFGQCYHMFEVITRPDHIEMWYGAAHGQAVDWNELFKDFAATVDWPACYYWRELANYYPEARVLLSVRDPDSWYRSISETIFQALSMPAPPNAPEPLKRQMAMAKKLIGEATFGGRFDDKAHALAVFQQHIDTVRATIPPQRLLVYEVAQGWEALCQFLGVQEPDGPFPHLNEAATTKAMMQQFQNSQAPQ